MNSFHTFSKMMVVVSVAVMGNVFGMKSGQAEGVTVGQGFKVGVMKTSNGFAHLQPAFVHAVRKTTESDNMATAAATSFYVLNQANQSITINMNGDIVLRPNASITCSAAKTAGYATTDRGLRYLENMASKYGIDQKALIKALKKYLPEQAGEVAEKVVPVAAEQLHGFVVNSVGEIVPTVLTTVISNVGSSSTSTYNNNF
jgi:hypothetical protein